MPQKPAGYQRDEVKVAAAAPGVHAPGCAGSVSRGSLVCLGWAGSQQMVRGQHGELWGLVLKPTTAVGCCSPTALDCNSYKHIHAFIWFLQRLC